MSSPTRRLVALILAALGAVALLAVAQGERHVEFARAAAQVSGEEAPREPARTEPRPRRASKVALTAAPRPLDDAIEVLGDTKPSAGGYDRSRVAPRVRGTVLLEGGQDSVSLRYGSRAQALREWRFGRVESAPLATVHSGEVFDLPAPAPGKEELWVTGPGSAPLRVPIPTGAWRVGAELAPLTPQRGVELAGFLVDETGRALAGAEVLYRETGQAAPLSTLSGPAGEFALPVRVANAGELRVRRAGYVLDTFDLANQVTGHGTALVLQLSTGSILGGRVAGAEETDTRWIVRARPEPNSGQDFEVAVAQDGTFAFADVPAGEFGVTLIDSVTLLPWSETLRVRSGATGLRLSPHPERRIRILVQDRSTGAPVSQPELQIELSGRPPCAAPLADELPGTVVRTQAFQPGVLRVRAAGYREQVVDLRGAGEVKRVQLDPLSTARVRVTTEASGARLSGAVVSVRTQGGRGARPSSFQRTDDTGRATVSVDPRERSYVLVTHPGFLPERAPILPEGEVEIRLRAAATLEVTVVGASGAPVRDARVEVVALDRTERASPALDLEGYDRTDGAGRIVRRGLAPGAYRVQLLEPLTSSGGLLVMTDHFELDLDRDRRVRLDPAGRRDLSVRLTQAGRALAGAALGLGSARSGTAGADGSIELRGLLAAEHLTEIPAWIEHPILADRFELELPAGSGWAEVDVLR